MRQGGVAVAFAQQVDPAAGRIDITLTRTTDVTGASGAGLLAALLLEPVAAGTSPGERVGRRDGAGRRRRAAAVRARDRHREVSGPTGRAHRVRDDGGSRHGPTAGTAGRSSAAASRAGPAGTPSSSCWSSSTILLILASAVLPLARVTMQRQREIELRRTLRELRLAIDRYKDAVDAGLIGATDVKAGSEGTRRTSRRWSRASRWRTMRRAAS